MREPGYYWCRKVAVWIVVEFRYEAWWLPGLNEPVYDEYFDEIDERRIVRQLPESTE